jgi:transposase
MSRRAPGTTHRLSRRRWRLPWSGAKRLSELAQLFDVHPSQITQWKAQLQEGAAEVFGSGGSPGVAKPTVDVKSLHAKIGELTLENDFLEGALSKAGLLSARR